MFNVKKQSFEKKPLITIVFLAVALVAVDKEFVVPVSVVDAAAIVETNACRTIT